MDEESIFTTALEMKYADRRADYLDEACAGNADLRGKIDELLCAYAQAGGFLDQATAAWNAHLLIDDGPATTEGPGTVLGSYKLLEQIGEGGMGLVFMAEQSKPVRRRVALKVLKPGMDTRQVVARFEAERQALALMDHPHICKVFDAGATESGRPYFVMELVRGVPITDFCDQHRFTTRQRLELFVIVCQAVQEAHRKGIIHRDLKPSNVLVTLHDTIAVPKIIDFGIAKATGQKLTERTLFTNFAQMIGTPLYMSPEQAEMNGLDVDTRSDVYSLGVLLYELLTGTTPFESETLKKVGLDEMRRIIREEEPPRPSHRVSTLGVEASSTVSERRAVDGRRLNQLLKGELDWVVMKSLDKDRNRRYESASAFAAEVQRYLNDEQVEACPPSAGYRLRKFVRRNRGALATVSVIVVALVAATAVSAWQAVVARDAQHQAEADRDRAEQAERQAAAISDFLQRDLLLQVNRDHLQRDGFPPEPNLTVKEAVHRAAASIGNRFQDQPLVEAGLRHTIGRALRSLGENRLAAAQLERAVELRRVHLGPDHPDTLDCLFTLAMAYQSDRRHDAINLLEHVLQYRTAAFGPDHESTLTALNSLGEVCRQAGLLDKAAGLIEQALERRRATIGVGRAETANSMHDLGLVYRDLGRYEEAIHLLEQATKKLDALCGDDANTFYSMQNLAEAYERAGKFDLADRQFREIITRTEKKNRHIAVHFTNQRVGLSQKLLRQKKSPEAETVLRACLAFYERAASTTPERFVALSLLGEALLDQQKYAAAEPLLLQGFDRLRSRQAKMPPHGGPWPTDAAERIVRFYETTNQPDKAREWREKLKAKETGAASAVK